MKTIILLSLLQATSVFSKAPCDRIVKHGYPCETHAVVTRDGYNLTLVRIPYSHNLQNQDEPNKSVVFFMHGLVSSSDTFTLNGPEDGLMYMLSDAGYDVWSGNSRGNDYSPKHIEKFSFMPSFWEFSWHEIGCIDVPAKIDYILEKTGQKNLHYIGHSQGATTLFVMLSTYPKYNSKIKTSHLLAPAIYMENVKSPLFKILKFLRLDEPGYFNNFIGRGQLMGEELFYRLIPLICQIQPSQKWCSNLLFLIAGGTSSFINQTLLADVFETHPSDCSARQLLHFLQGQYSKEFRRYDFGPSENQLRYGNVEPPTYQLENINTLTPINLYYSDNDDWSTAKDIRRLGFEMGEKVALYHVIYPEFNHIDFLFAENLKEVINNCVLDLINKYEGKQFSGDKCNRFLEVEKF